MFFEIVVCPDCRIYVFKGRVFNLPELNLADNLIGFSRFFGINRARLRGPPVKSKNKIPSARARICFAEKRDTPRTSKDWFRSPAKK